MKCPKCQHENPDTQKFCGECGAKLEKVCPNCGESNPPQFKFCGECGLNLIEPPEALPVDYNQPQSYTPKHLADKILTTRSSIEGERKLVTVLFADVANYSAISEKLDPEEVHQIMDGCFKILMDEIHKFEGTINQFTGDGVMALFGAPLAHEDHAQRACHAALAIQRALEAYGESLVEKFGVGFMMRVGLNSGQVVVGSIGDDLRMDYTAVGDTTNLAARMESQARPGTVLVSGDTHRLVRDFFEFESLGKIEVKGKKEPQEAFELIKTGEVETRIGASVAKGLTRFVGRKNSMAALLDAFEKVKSGSGQVVGLVGEAGVGKSRLLLEIRNMLPQGEYRYLEGRCLHFGVSMAYLPILDILRAYFDIKEGDQESLLKKKMEKKILDLDEKLKGVLSPFQELLSLKVDDEGFTKLEPKEKRQMTFEAIRDLLIRESQSKTLILAIEDLHWIDKTSEEFIDYLIGWLANTPIMLLLLYRPEYTHPWGSKSYYTKVGLDQLGTNSSSELVKAILEEGEMAPELRQLILNRAAGNPLFMEEFTHTLLENGSIERKDEKYVLSGKAFDIQVPDTIQGIIAARMDRLEENLKRTMQVASVIGRDFAFRILQTITGMREGLKSYLLNLQGLEFIYEKSLFPELEYIFKHALTQEVAYNSLLLKRRKEIHEKIGKAIEELYPERLEEFSEMLAHHYYKSDNSMKAYQYMKASGNKSNRSHSLWEAFRFFKDAINILDRLPETEEDKKEKIEVIALLSIPMGLLGYPEDSLQILQKGERLSKEYGDSRALSTFYSKIGNCQTHRGELSLGLEYNEKAFEEARKIQDIELMTQVAFYLCVSYQPAGEYEKLVDIASPVIDLLEETKREEEFYAEVNIYSGLCGYYGMSKSGMGYYKEAEVFFQKGLRSAQKLGDPRTLGLVEFLYGLQFSFKGDWELSLEPLQKAIMHLEKAKWPLLLGLAWSGLGYSYSYLGDIERAREYVERGLKIQSATTVKAWLYMHYIFLAKIHLDLNDIKNARAFAEEGLKISQDNNEILFEGQSLIVLGRILGKEDPTQHNQAEEYILKGMKILEGLKQKTLHSIGHLALGELYMIRGEKEKMLENFKRAARMFREMGMTYWLNITKNILEML
jgi:class 3 adenylate cyclase/tetratricopeptide (TPR) repeat protein